MPRVPVGMAAVVTAAADQAVGGPVAVPLAVGPLVVALAVLAVVPAVGAALAHLGVGRMAVGPVPRDGDDEHARRLRRCAWRLPDPLMSCPSVGARARPMSAKPRAYSLPEKNSRSFAVNSNVERRPFIGALRQQETRDRRMT